MAKFKTKPVIKEAIQFTGKNKFQVCEFMKGGGEFNADFSEHSIQIHTLEGSMTVSPGDWVIKGLRGEFYPCKPDIFDKTYEPV